MTAKSNFNRSVLEFADDEFNGKNELNSKPKTIKPASFEQYLQLMREGYLSSVNRTIQHEIDKANELVEWLHRVTEGKGVVLVDNEQTRNKQLRHFNRKKVTGIDIETAKTAQHELAGLHPKLSLIRTVQLWQPGQPVLVLDCNRLGHDWIKSLIGFNLYAHNALFELCHLKLILPVLPEIKCTMLMLRPFIGMNLSLVKAMAAFDEGKTEEQGQPDAFDALGIHLSKALQVSDWKREDLFQEQINYAAADAVAAALLANEIEALFDKFDESYLKTFRHLHKLQTVILNQAPIAVDWEAHFLLMEDWKGRAALAENLLNEQGLSNPNSTLQKQAWLRKMLGDDVGSWPETKSGKIATDKDTINRKSECYPQLKVLADYMRNSSLAANFGGKWARLSVNGSLYPNYRIAGAANYRFGCSNPNLQNTPRTGLRRIVIAPQGHSLVTGDLSQIELRVAGLLAEESVINIAYISGQDLHKLMAANITGKAVADITKADRQMAKAANFGLLYGAGAKTLQVYAASSYGVTLSLDDAELIKTVFHETYPTLTEWQREVVAYTNEVGYSQSHYLGARRHYEDKVYTQAMNFPVSATSWELLSLALIYVDENKPADDSIKISHHVYDELCLVTRDERLDEAGKLLKAAFLYAYDTIFPGEPTTGLIGIGSGKDWVTAASDDSVRLEWSL